MLLVSLLFVVHVICLQLTENTIFHIQIPIVLKLDGKNGYTTDGLFISNLIKRTQLLIDDDLKTLNWKENVKYEIKLYNQLKIDTKNYYEIKLLHSDNESFFISPFNDKIIYIYQTEYLIAKNLMSEFIKNIILKSVFAFEILEYVNLIELVDSPLDDYEKPLDLYLNELKLKNLNNILILTSPTLILKITFKYLNPNVFKEFDFNLYEELIEKNLVNYLSDYVNLIPVIQFNSINVTDDDIIYNEVNNTINMNKFLNSLNFTEINLFVYLCELNDEIYFQNFNETPILIDENEIKTNSKGGLQFFKIDEIFRYHQQIEIYENITGQLLKILGLHREPKSPFIRLDFLIRKQLYLNFNKLFDCSKHYYKLIKNVFRTGEFEKALKLSWEYLRCYDEMIYDV